MIRLLILLLNLYAWVIIARALVSWFSPNPLSPLVRLLHQATEPVLKPLRQVVSPSGIGGIDISPILAIVLIQVAKYLVITLAYRVSLPEAARRLFPHLADDNLSLDRAEAAILERLLEDGDRVDLRWLTTALAEERLSRWVSERGSRQLSDRSRAFWSVVLDLPVPGPRVKGELLWPL